MKTEINNGLEENKTSIRTKKVTMNDIAKDVGISLATVSYVLNHSRKEKISHETRLKVYDAAKRLGYVPNASARKNNMIGIIVNYDRTVSVSKKMHYLALTAALEESIAKMGYCTSLKITDNIKKQSESWANMLEAAFVIDINEDDVKSVTPKYYVPLVFVGCDFDDSYFWKIIPDYDEAMKRAKNFLGTEDVYVVTEDITNKKVLDSIIKNVKEENLFIDDGSGGIKSFLAEHRMKKGIIVGDFLAMQVEKYIDNENIVAILGEDNNILLPDTKRILISNKRVADEAIGIMEKLLDFTYDLNVKETKVMVGYRTVH